MRKINQEEYKVLKGLGDKWKWIARDEDGEAFMYECEPYRVGTIWNFDDGVHNPLRHEDHFQFIQWEDSEPYNIQELIEEYEEHEFYEYVGWEYYRWEYHKREETEGKKDKEWLKKEINELPLIYYKFSELRLEDVYAVVKDDVLELVDQLDEPETLTKWRLGKRIGHQEVIQLGKLLEEKENLERKLYVTKKEINQLYGKYNLDKTN